MNSPDPFADAAFTSRLQKLLSMLGSAQPGEAEAARRKLIEHLAQQHLSLLDLAQRLQNSASLRSPFSQSAREASLEHQLALAREAKEEALQELRRTAHRLQTLQIDADQSAYNVGQVLQNQGKTRALAIVGWTAAAFCLGLAIFVPKYSPAPEITADAVKNFTQDGPPTMQPVDPSAHLAAGETIGSAAVQDLPMRLGPSNDASIRAFLNRGQRVAILQQVHSGNQTWLLIRTATGTGWARAGDVIH